MEPLSILIIGDSCNDVYTYVKSNRLAPDKPVPVVEVIDKTYTPGMAMNVYKNLESFGANVDIITNDGWENFIKERIVDKNSNHMFVRIDKGNVTESFQFDVSLILSYDTIIISDYDKGFLKTTDIEDICVVHPQVFLDTKKVLGPWAQDAKFIKINNYEHDRSEEFIKSSLQEKVIQTMGGDGCLYQGVNYPVEKVDVMDVSGAGDTFLAALVYDYTTNHSIEEAIQFANRCASLVVRKQGMTTV